MGTLTIGPGITIHGKNGSVYDAFGNGGLVNQGTIGANAGTGTINVGDNGTTPFTNQGTILGSTGQTLTLGGVNWVNAGTIAGNGGTIKLGGSFTTAALGNFTDAGGMVSLMGTLNNTSTTLILSPSLGAWNLRGGTIVGGTVSSTGGILPGRVGTPVGRCQE